MTTEDNARVNNHDTKSWKRECNKKQFDNNIYR